ncbi:MAG: hypothetical protein Q9162_006604 [Coniocarpon cinnabarinum]
MERRALRRAIYRLWLYDAAFHNHGVTRFVRMNPQQIRERTLLLHNWNNQDLADMANAHAVIREVLKSNICPSNGAIERKFRKRFPNSAHQLMFNVHLSCRPAPSTPLSLGQRNNFMDRGVEDPTCLSHPANFDRDTKFRPTSQHEPGAEGWGDDINHYYVIEDMLKLNPQQVLWLKDNAPSKGEVESFVKQFGEWFDNNGETFEQTLDVVLAQRGVDVGGFRDGVQSGEQGITVGNVVAKLFRNLTVMK